MTTPVSYKLANLLTNTNFNQKNVDNGYVLSSGKLSHDYALDYINGKAIAAPTIAQAVMWLYEEHMIWIYVKHGFGWEYFVEKADNSNTLFYNDGTFNSPAEAYESGIKYILENLI